MLLMLTFIRTTSCYELWQNTAKCGQKSSKPTSQAGLVCLLRTGSLKLFYVSCRDETELCLISLTRYNSITRFNSDLSRTARPRRKPTETQLYHFRRKSESASSSSSASPSSPPMGLPSLTSFPPILENSEPPYQFDSFSTSWSSSSSVTSEDLSFRSSPNSYEYMQESNNASNSSSSPPSIEPGYQTFDISMNPTLSYSQSPTASGLHSQNGLYKPFTSNNHIQDQTYPGYSQFPLVHGNDDSNHFAIFGGLSQTPIDPSSVIGMHNWDPALSSSMTEPKASDNCHKVPPFTVRTLSWTLTRRGRMLTWCVVSYSRSPCFSMYFEISCRVFELSICGSQAPLGTLSILVLPYYIPPLCINFSLLCIPFKFSKLTHIQRAHRNVFWYIYTQVYNDMKWLISPCA